ncbi:hypothetical protein BDV98DRAFT_567919 [Pterulicium gracile]|uniref:Short-chain dehydrogenase n=1 Tax=Pterulicium gracile TaxID=1884261 RepID=A0A5C3QLI4_9AGAR|nr:hypothetical protein BDV98DRAFT_567919 [Pterula gracilis]
MGKLSFWEFVKNQRAEPLPVKHRDLTGQTVLVLGANTGLGFEAAKHFARMKPERLILACRNQRKGDQALQELRKETGYAGGEVRIVDLADFASVTKFAEKFNEEVLRLDIFVANAGMTSMKFEATKDGHESILQVNHLATSLLCLLLLPKLAQSSQAKTDRRPRLTIVASETHFWTKFDAEATESDNLLEKLSNEEYSQKKIRDRYPQSKMLNILFTRALASYLPVSSSPVVVDAVNPGFCYSSIRADLPWFVRMMTSLMERFLPARTTEVGSRQLVWAALEGGDKGVHGQYVSDFKAQEPSDYIMESADLQERVWDETIRLLAKVDPKVSGIVQKLKSGEL